MQQNISDDNFIGRIFVYICLTIKPKKIMGKKNYVTPEVEVIDVAVEQGFAASGEPKFGGFGPEDNWG